jgi:hypothetical protein
MKKSISILALLAIIATGAFAQGFPPPMSAGGGLLFDWSFNNGVKTKIEGSRVYMGLNILSLGGFGFFDATYAELDVNFAYGLVTYIADAPGFKETDIGNALQLGFSLLGKYPIGLGSFTLFPLLGANYNLVLSGKDPDGRIDKPMEYSQFGILAGAGLDFPLTSALYLRGEALFNLRFPSKLMKDTTDAGDSPTLGMGPRIKIGVGYKFGGGSGSTSSASSTRSQSGRYMLVNADTLNVRSGPSADTSLVGTLQRNARVEVLDRSGTWWKIKSGNIEGYVNSSYLKEEN